MGWNTGFEIMEATTMGAAKLGVLDKRLCRVLLKPYKGTDIDSGGKAGLRHKGMEIEELVIVTMLGASRLPKKPAKRERHDCPPGEGECPTCMAWEVYYDELCEAFDKATGW